MADQHLRVGLFPVLGRLPGWESKNKQVVKTWLYFYSRLSMVWPRAAFIR